MENNNLIDDRVIDNGRLRVGDIVQHFKREFLSPDQFGTPKYLYVIVALAYHSETAEPLVIYKALYDNHKICARPLEMFISEVDHVKYPGVKQKYRFERLAANYGKEI